jgi:Flp pilus assembly pilin Flp
MFPQRKICIDFVLPQGEKGQDLPEYALLLALISILVIGSIQLLGNNIAGVLETIGTALTSILP